MEGSKSRTSLARVRQARARGTWSRANWAIIMKNMMNIAYWMTAVIEPICIAWTPTRSAPIRKISDSTPLAKKNVIVSVTAKTRLTRMARWA